MRKELELSQREFAARLGTTTQTLADWEEGEGGASKRRRQNDPRSDQCALQKVMGEQESQGVARTGAHNQ
ncbi:helix-turn-helix domain-containing protein [Xylella fastidiosa subsp. multiplex]|uniref:helix-turn-helix domain-containing protein n=1 Tax=Xylella fastidiosa TaxID=2371 RepID=UPI0035D4A1F6